LSALASQDPNPEPNPLRRGALRSRWRGVESVNKADFDAPPQHDERRERLLEPICKKMRIEMPRFRFRLAGGRTRFPRARVDFQEDRRPRKVRGVGLAFSIALKQEFTSYLDFTAKGKDAGLSVVLSDTTMDGGIDAQTAAKLYKVLYSCDKTKGHAATLGFLMSKGAMVAAWNPDSGLTKQEFADAWDAILTAAEAKAPRCSRDEVCSRRVGGKPGVCRHRREME